MPKGKSSASAGTRKKHAKKAAGKVDEDGPPPKQKPTKLQRGQKKLSKAQQRAQPKVKQYIPPPKPPAPPIPDPLDGLGLARTLPAELVVVLRRLGKKDDVTRRKGLEELKEGWVAEIMRATTGEEEEVEKEIKETALVSAVPVWMHNLASLLQSPFHRTMAIQVHADLLSISSTRTAILDTLSLSLLPGTQNRDILGSWLVAALEEGRRAGGLGLKSWEESTTWLATDVEAHGRIDLSPQLTTLVEYLSLSILDPPSLHDDIHPAPVSSTPAAAPPPKGTKGGKGKSFAPPAPTPTEPTQEETEVASERLARYRVGGLVGLAWLLQQVKQHDRSLSEEISGLTGNTALWSSLSSLPPDDGSPAFGYQHSPVRRAAYSVLGILVDSFPAEIAKEEMLQTLSREMLDSIWLEKEATVWETAGPAVVKILSRHRDIWSLSVSLPRENGNEDEREDGDGEDDNDDDEDGDDTDEDKDDGEEDGDGPAGEPDKAEDSADLRGSVSTRESSVAFERFLGFISTICPSIPHRTYPLLLVIVSTLPPTLLSLSGPSPQVKTFFAHLWSPVDARLLSTHALPGQPSAFQAFLRDAVDCTTYLIGKASKAEEQEAVEWLVMEQLGGRVWKEGVLELGGRSAGRRTVQGSRPEQEATIFGQALARLATVSPDDAIKLADRIDAWTVESVSPGEDSKRAVALLPRLLPIIAAIRTANESTQVQSKLDQLVGRIAETCVAVLRDTVSSPSPGAAVYTETLLDALKSRPDLVKPDTRKATIDLVQSSSASLLAELSPALFGSLLQTLGSLSSDSQERTQGVVRSLLESAQIDRDVRFALAQGLLGTKSTTLTSDSLDSIAEEAAQSALNNQDPSAASLVTACLSHSELSPDALHTILALVSTSIHDSVYDLLTAHPEARVPQAAIEIFSAHAQNHLPQVIDSDILGPALVALHHLVVLLPRLHESGHGIPDQATNVWQKTAELEASRKDSLTGMILKDLSGLIQDISCRVEPSILVDVSLVVEQGLSNAETAQRVLPEASVLQQLVEEYTGRSPDPTLAIADSLISSSSEEAQAVQLKFDSRGRSKAARMAEAALAFIKSDRKLASTNPTLLQTILSARILAQDALAVPGASRGFLDAVTSPEYLAEMIREAEGALSFSLGGFDEVDLVWHKGTVDMLKNGSSEEKGDFLQTLLGNLVSRVKGPEDDVMARTVRDVLGRHLRQSGASEAEAEVWLSFGLSKSETNPILALALLLAVKPFLLDAKSFDTAQNRFASNLSGIRVQQANKKGVPAMRLLVASAPPADAASVFIPQQRALFVMKHVAGWLTSEEADDLDEEVEYRVAELYTALAPIVQDVQGAHWDSIFDLIETGLDAASLDDSTTYGLLHQCLLLLQQVRDLCETNKTLRAAWTSKKTHLSLVLKLFLQCRDAKSAPVQLIQTLLLDLLRDAGEDVVGDSGLPELCDLIGKSSSSSVQSTAYRLLSQVIKRKTLALVLDVEASISQDDQPTRIIELPKGLIDIAHNGKEVDWHEEPALELVMGQLLAWMAILDHFDDASRTIRWAYLDQLNTSDLLVNSLLPMLFAILGVSEVGAWNFPASQFAVDEFYPDLLQPEELADLTPLASHVFYRALVTIPSAIRTYYEGLKDRQLSMSMLNFTARHYSPVIIQHEFAALREPQAMATLTEEGLNIKITQGGGATVAAGGGASEAIASYVVDEQPMEIGIRLPAEFPLRGVDVRDLRRVGVPENKWRGWLMSVQQTITSRNGLILEALTLFKRNVSLHFEGVVECAICYSIISLTDRTLPTKPCRTCKNRFHASCLYKWFNSSHTSSCPLCRALF